MKKELDTAIATLKESMKDLDAVLDEVQKRCTEKTITELSVLRTLYDISAKSQTLTAIMKSLIVENN